MDETFARQVISQEISRQEEMVSALGLHVELIPDVGDERTPYLALTYMAPSLTDIHVRVYEQPLVELAQRYAHEDEFRERFAAALSEELTHGTHFHLVLRKFEEMSPLDRCHFRTPFGLLQDMNAKIFRDLASTEQGSELLITSAQLYYENSDILTVDDIVKKDLKWHGWAGYSVSELIRQTTELHCGRVLAEEAKRDLWDNTYRYFGPKNMLPLLANKFRHLSKHVTHPYLEEMVGNIQAYQSHIQQPNLLYSPVQLRKPQYAPGILTYEQQQEDLELCLTNDR